MKKVKLNSKKLQLIKEKIADLNTDQMRTIVGGGELFETTAPSGGPNESLVTCWACITYACSKKYCTVDQPAPPDPPRESTVYAWPWYIC